MSNVNNHLGNKPYTGMYDELDNGELRGDITIYYRRRVKGDSKFGPGWCYTSETFTNLTSSEAFTRFKAGMAKYDYFIFRHSEDYRYE